jgi:hypothetical protein
MTVLGERVANLKDSENIVLERERDLTKEARNIHDGLNGIRACDLVRRTVKVVGGKIGPWACSRVLRLDDFEVPAPRAVQTMALAWNRSANTALRAASGQRRGRGAQDDAGRASQNLESGRYNLGTIASRS